MTDKPVTPIETPKTDAYFVYFCDTDVPLAEEDVFEFARTLERELAELRTRIEAMRPYLQHKVDCSKAAPGMREFAAPVCSCGLDALLAPDAGT